MIICRICFSRIFAKLQIEDSRLDSWVFLVCIISVGFRFWQHFNYKLKMTIWYSLLTRFGINCSSKQTSGYLLSPSFKSVWHRAQNPLHCAGDNAHRFVSALSRVPESSTVGLFPGCWPSCGPLPSTWTGFVAHGCAAFPPAQPPLGRHGCGSAGPSPLRGSMEQPPGLPRAGRSSWWQLPAAGTLPPCPAVTGVSGRLLSNLPTFQRLTQVAELLAAGAVSLPYCSPYPFFTEYYVQEPWGKKYRSCCHSS